MRATTIDPSTAASRTDVAVGKNGMSVGGGDDVPPGIVTLSSWHSVDSFASNTARTVYVYVDPGVLGLSSNVSSVTLSVKLAMSTKGPPSVDRHTLLPFEMLTGVQSISTVPSAARSSVRSAGHRKPSGSMTTRQPEKAAKATGNATSRERVDGARMISTVAMAMASPLRDKGRTTLQRHDEVLRDDIAAGCAQQPSDVTPRARR